MTFRARRTGWTTVSVVCLLVILPGHLRSAQQPNPDPIRRARHPVAERYLVRVHGGVDADSMATESATRFKGQVGHIYRHSVQGFSVRMSDAAARTLARDPRVALVEEDGVVVTTAVQSNPPSWGLDRIDQRMLPLDDKYVYPAVSEPVNVYIVDSGIRPTHIEFEGRAFFAGDFVDDDGDGDPADVANDDEDPTAPDGADCIGHGTHMAATVGGATVGVARTPLIWSLRVVGCNGLGTWSSVIAAIDQITEEVRRPAVVNLSLGGAPSEVADEAIRRSIAAGITYVVAAGNFSDDASNYSPSRIGEALVVGSAAANDQRSTFSNFGAALDLFAPGEAIVSAGVDNDVDLSSASGTSSAAAHAAGVAALYLGLHPLATPLEVAAAITASATSGIIADVGPGPNRLLFSGFLTFTPSVTVTSPNSDANWGRGSLQTIEWTHNLPPQTLMRVRISRDGGRTYSTIADRLSNTGKTTGRFMWQVTGPNTNEALVRVESRDRLASDRSDTPFVISDPYIRVRRPNGSEVWTAGQTVQVRWESNLGRTDQVAIALSKNDGRTYHWMLANSTDSDGAEAVVVERSSTTQRGRVRISWLANSGVDDVSDRAFMIKPK